MTNYYTEAQLTAAVRRQAEIDRVYYTNYRSAVRTQNRGWLYELVKVAVRFTVGSLFGDVIALGVDAVWDYFADLFS